MCTQEGLRGSIFFLAWVACVLPTVASRVLNERGGGRGDRRRYFWVGTH